jgi:hypothetical protein
MNLNDLIISCFTTDSNGNVALRATGISGGPAASGGLTLVATNTLASDAQTSTFSGLDGDTDGVYLIIADLICVGGVAITLQPNGVTTNQSTQYQTNQQGTGSAQSNTATLLLCNGSQDGAANSNISITSTFFASKLIGSTAIPRRMISTAQFICTSGGHTNHIGCFYSGGYWNETSTNVTSIVIAANVANALRTGSRISLYKYAQS